MNAKKKTGEGAKVDHPVAGASTVDRTKLAVRWREGVTAEERRALLEELELELFRIETPGEAEARGGRPLLEANQTEGLSWVVRRGGGQIRQETLRSLEGSERVAWVSPALRAGRGSGETESLFCVNPQRLYVAEEVRPLLAELETGELRLTVDSRRTGRLPGLVVLEIPEPSVADGRTSVEAADA